MVLGSANFQKFFRWDGWPPCGSLTAHQEFVGRSISHLDRSRSAVSRIFSMVAVLFVFLFSRFVILIVVNSCVVF